MTEIVKAIKRSFKELLDACKQDRVSSEFNEKNFPPEPVADDEADWEVYEYHFDKYDHFDKYITGLRALDELVKLGYRLCDSRQAMEWIANGHLNIQLDHPLIVTARWRRRNSDGGWYAPVFGNNFGGRSLNLAYLGDRFPPYYSWLVLRKKTA